MKVAIFPGSFNPWHDGHLDILDKALQIFDRVIVVKADNYAKTGSWQSSGVQVDLVNDSRVYFTQMGCDEFLADYVAEVKPDAIIRGLRNSTDFEYEKNMQYWNEDLGIKIPTVFLISERNLVHASSSAIRAVEQIRMAKKQKHQEILQYELDLKGSANEPDTK